MNVSDGAADLRHFARSSSDERPSAAVGTGAVESQRREPTAKNVLHAVRRPILRYCLAGTVGRVNVASVRCPRTGFDFCASVRRRAAPAVCGDQSLQCRRQNWEDVDFVLEDVAQTVFMDTGRRDDIPSVSTNRLRQNERPLF